MSCEKCLLAVALTPTQKNAVFMMCQMILVQGQLPGDFQESSATSSD